MRFNKEEFEIKIAKYALGALLIWGLVELIEGTIDGRCCHKACLKQGYVDSDCDFKIRFGYVRSTYPYHPTCTCFSAEALADPSGKRTGAQIQFKDN